MPDKHVMVVSWDGDLTAIGGNRLFRNLGDGRFADVTAKAGDLAKLTAQAVGSAWGDFDAKQMAAKIQEAFKDWPRAEVDLPPVPPVPPPTRVEPATAPKKPAPATPAPHSPGRA